MGWFINPYRFDMAQSGFIFAGSNGSGGDVTRRIGYTKNLITWENSVILNSPPDSTYYGSAYSAILKRAVVTGSLGRMAYSNNLTNWNLISFGNNSFTIRDIVRSESQNLFVAVGDSGFGIAKSTDGIIWTIVNGYESLCVSHSPILNNYVALNRNGGRISSDGTNWSSITLPTSAYNKVIWLNGVNKFYAIGSFSLDGTNFASSSDGINWTGSTMPGSGVRNWFSIGYSETLNIYVLSGRQGSVTPVDTIYTSTNGINWTLRNTTNRFFDIHWSTKENKFIATGIGGNWTSTDGITWTLTLANEYNNIYNTLTEL